MLLKIWKSMGSMAGCRAGSAPENQDTTPYVQPGMLPV
jgi:hypothetical protein